MLPRAGSVLGSEERTMSKTNTVPASNIYLYKCLSGKELTCNGDKENQSENKKEKQEG